MSPSPQPGRGGAYAWSDEQREAFANDPENLLAADSSSNRSKGDKTPEKWMPRNQEAACGYGEAFLAVSVKYNLSYSEADLASVNEACS